MARATKIVGGLAVLVLVIIAGRHLLSPGNRTPEGDPFLTAVPKAESFAPPDLPGSPVLDATSGQDLAVAFGYRVGGTPYSYTLALRFAADAEGGTATLVARHAGKTATVETKALRLWDAPREAYAVAVQGAFDLDPPVPALCAKAVIGPSKARYDLAHASLCVAQRDAAGKCHPETLACGQIRSKS